MVLRSACCLGLGSILCFGSEETLAAQGQRMIWRAFDFRDGEHFKYEVVSRTPGTAVKGSVTIDVRIAGGGAELEVAGERAGEVLPAVRLAFRPGDPSSFASPEWARDPLGGLLQETLFAAGWAPLFGGRELEPGVRWAARGPNYWIEVEVSGACRVAGLDGVQGRWVLQGPVPEHPEARWCIAPTVPLVLEVETVIPEGQASMALTLVAYRPAGPAVAAGLRLDGLYLGVVEQGEVARWYHFKASGRVIVDPPYFLDPDEVAAWRELPVRLYGMDWIPVRPGDPVPKESRLTMGSYELSGGRVRLRTQRTKVDLEQRLLLVDAEPTGLEDWDVEAKSFRGVQDSERLEIDGVLFVRQGDQTGRKLAGEYLGRRVTLFGFTQRAGAFTAQGEFSLEEVSSYQVMAVGGGEDNTGRGRYEVRGHEIVFHYADGRVEKRLFSDLGGQAGGTQREAVAIGDLVWKKGKR